MGFGRNLYALSLTHTCTDTHLNSTDTPKMKEIQVRKGQYLEMNLNEFRIIAVFLFYLLE